MAATRIPFFVLAFPLLLGVVLATTLEGNIGVLILNGKNYTLKQMHWHSPSEHRIDGVQYPAELHLVHISNDGSITVVAILYQYGDADQLVSKIKNSLDELAKEVSAGHEEAQIHVGTIDVKPIRRSTRKYYRYISSLTTPPCTENVIWNVLGKGENNIQRASCCTEVSIAFGIQEQLKACAATQWTTRRAI